MINSYLNSIYAAEIDETLNVNIIITIKIDQSKIEQLGV